MIAKQTHTGAHSAKRTRRAYAYAVGRRKSAIARVRLYEKERGEMEVNGKKLPEYFPLLRWQKIVMEPLDAAGEAGKSRVTVRVAGGGVKSQAESIRHGISRVLVAVDPALRPAFRAANFLTRDARVKERKKYGLKRARRAPQWQKR